MTSTSAADAYGRLCSVVVHKRLLREHELPHVTDQSVARLVDVCIDKKLLTHEQATNLLPSQPNACHSLQRLVDVCIEKKLLQPEQALDLIPDQDGDFLLSLALNFINRVGKGVSYVGKRLFRRWPNDAEMRGEELAFI